MDPESVNQRLSQIQTLWTLVRHAHQVPEGSPTAQKELLDRYGGAVERYLLGALRDPDAADEVFQEFAIRLLKGGMTALTRNAAAFATSSRASSITSSPITTSAANASRSACLPITRNPLPRKRRCRTSTAIWRRARADDPGPLLGGPGGDGEAVAQPAVLHGPAFQGRQCRAAVTADGGTARDEARPQGDGRRRPPDAPSGRARSSPTWCSMK